jgi:arylsulfatase A-like enzyme/tetratricopeptide (TPR) repeat protein
MWSSSRSKDKWIAAAALLAAACGRGEVPGVPVADNASVLLVTVDTLRADRVGAGITPEIDALAASGVAFTGARANVPLTLPSHTTILTGTLPPSHGVRENGAGRFDGSRPTLATIFKKRGYRTGAFVGAYVLDASFGLNAGFDTYDDRIRRDPRAPTRLEAERPATEVVDAAIEWVTGGVFFLWVHLYDPHAPYNPPQEYAQRAGGKAYEGEVAYADAQIGRLVRAVRERTPGPLVVAVTGDHGESLGEHGEPTHGMLLYEGALRVPLVIAAWRDGSPAALGASSDSRPVSLQDVAPTLLTLAGASVPPGMTGDALFDRPQAPGPGPQGPSAQAPSDSYAESVYPRTAGWSPVRSITDGRWKLIVSSRAELYDLSADGAERHDVAAANGSVVRAMRGRIDGLWRPAGAPAVGAEAAERLRALGYVSAPKDPAPFDAAPNPADQIASWAAFERAFTDLSAGRAADAVGPLAALAERHPDAAIFQSSYARALGEAGRHREALARYRTLVARWPRDATLFHELAVAAGASGAFAEAIKGEQAAIALDPAFASAHNGLGLQYAKIGKPHEAAAAFAKAAELDPRNAAIQVNLGNARRELGDNDAARIAYQTALRLEPDDVDAANGLGVLLVQMKRYIDAISYFERALARAPDMYQARLNLGVAFQESGQVERAAEAYRAVIAAAPQGSRERDAAVTLLRSLH